MSPMNRSAQAISRVSVVDASNGFISMVVPPKKYRIASAIATAHRKDKSEDDDDISSEVEIMSAPGIEKSISPERDVLDEVVRQSETREVSCEWHDSPVV